MLFSRLQGEHETALALGVLRDARQTARHQSHVLLLRGQQSDIRSAETLGDAERLPFRGHKIGAKLTRRWKRESSRETPGTKLHRTTYHYWFHLGESQAVHQMLGHTKLPDFVGGFGKHQYRPEVDATAS